MSLIEELMPDIKAVAKSIAYKWSSVTTTEDMINSLVVHFLERPGSLEKVVGLPIDKRRAGLNRVAHQIASKERDDYDLFSGRYLYSVDEVKALLKRGVINSENTRFNPSAEDVLDGMIRLEKKNPQHTQAILDRYVDGKVPDRTGPGKDVLMRAIESLTLLMNRKHRSKSYDYVNGGRANNLERGIA